MKVPYIPGLGNVRPVGHMRPTKHLYVAREHLLGSLLRYLGCSIMLNNSFLSKRRSKNSFSSTLTFKFKFYITNTGPRRLNVLLIWPARPRELPTPGIYTRVYVEKFWLLLVIKNFISTYARVIKYAIGMGTFGLFSPLNH
jgi:hypothetical protein